MCSDGNIPPAVQEIEVATEVVEETEKPKSDKEDGTGAKDSAVLGKKDAPQEETSAAKDNAAKKYEILVSIRFTKHSPFTSFEIFAAV
jgi:hypothetical protein